MNRRERGKGDDKYVKITIHNASEITECGWVDEERWNKVDLALKVRALGELCFPSGCDAPLTELTCFTSERGYEGTAFVLELVGMSYMCLDEVDEGLSISGRTAW